MTGPGLRVLVTDADHGVLDIEEQVLAAWDHRLGGRLRRPDGLTLGVVGLGRIGRPDHVVVEGR